ncbi:uncharacterized protein FOMMEDRAFT_76910 [Fomitiporia mediterranea MF3/22]|uniref:uncharacterized protein n=1 Tax=Fomitiporia mediterranea (strain MF3/22) TaxID=694068 RepID=UPI0004407494|nr:uncharacterized protein FOMMEDRAFT_76910 [Fomitiporia mediterranea MF3/22]EJD07029.1 hypothetical protein FOMMEDRAFT_76910 [Fomitiporia mediterranea MF3/22]
MATESPSTLPSTSTPRATPERVTELSQNLAEIRERVRDSSHSVSPQRDPPVLVAVSKYKPASDILACYEQGQLDFGENYAQELVDKAKQLPQDIRWHFIGGFQTNKSKVLAGIPNLYALQTLASIKAADSLNRALPAERESSPLNVLLQVNTSGEDIKSGLPPLLDSGSDTKDEAMERSSLFDLAIHVLENCPRLYLQGLMTIGSLSESLSDTDENRDFETLVQTRNRLEEMLRKRYPDGSKWNENRKLLLSMGMSSDFEAAIKAGSDIVRVGTGIFGQRHLKEEK